jgi:hypothetical protein
MAVVSIALTAFCYLGITRRPVSNLENEEAMPART